jgi:hypothetical protein
LESIGYEFLLPSQSHHVDYLEMIQAINLDMNTCQRRKLKKIKIYKFQDGKCHYCGAVMVLGFPKPRKGHSHGKRLATFEHLDSRLSPERGAHAGEIRVVLACSDCNQKQNDIEVSRLPIEELWRRSGRFRREG